MVVFTFFACWATLQAQPKDLYFNHLTSVSGLSESINAYIYRDSKGFVWLSSTDGLNRFDGMEIKVYHPELGKSNALLGDNIQSAFFEDPEGDLWFGTNKALHCYRRRTDDFQQFQYQDSTGQAISETYHVFYRQEGQLWVRVGGNFYVIDWQQLKKGVPIDKTSSIVGKMTNIGQLRCFVRKSPGQQQLFDIFSTSYGFVPGIIWQQFDGTTLRDVKHWVFKDPDSNKTSWLLPDGGDSLWVATSKGLGLFTMGNGVLTFPSSGKLQLEGSVRSIIAYQQRYLFVSAENGLFLFDKKLGRLIKQYQHEVGDPSTLSKKSPGELYLDETGILWVSQWMVGVDYASLHKMKFEKIRLPLPDKTIGDTYIPKAICEDQQGRLWFGSNIHGLKVTDRQFNPVEMADPGKNNIEKIYCTPSGDIWILPDKSLPIVYDQAAKKFKTIPVKGIQLVDFCMALAMDNGRLWLQEDLSSRIFEARKVAGQWQIDTLPESVMPKGKYGIFFEDAARQLWAVENGTSIHLLQLKNGRYQKKRSFAINGKVLVFAETSDAVWAGGKFGLLQLPKSDQDTCRLFTKANGLPNETVYAILPDKKGRLWLSTNRGIVKFDANHHFTAYALADGLQDFEFNQNAYLQLSDGTMLLGGIRGFNHFHPDSVQELRTLPLVGLTGLKVNDELFALTKNVAELDSLTLDYYQNTFSIEFTSLEFSDPGNTQLRYQLLHANGAPYDNSWVRCKSAQGSARYANLPIGRYVLLIQAANSDGVWNDHSRRLFIEITPPFWLTWWFKLLSTLLLLGIILLFIRSYVQGKVREKNLQLREQRLHIEKQEALTQERNRIAAEMHDDFGSGLTAIQRISETAASKMPSPEGRKAIENITSYSLELISNMREIIWAMSGKNDTLENLMAYISENSYRYLGAHHIEIDIQQPEEIPLVEMSGERRRNIYLAVKECLHNVVKHAHATEVTVSFEINGTLDIHVRDNGKGFTNNNLAGNGMGNMAKRMADIGGKMKIENNGGAHLTFSVPIEKLKSQ